MYYPKWNPLENAEEHKIQARRRRDNGGSTVLVLNTTAALAKLRGGDPDRGTWRHTVAVAKANWRHSRAQAIEDFRWDCHADDWSGLLESFR